MSKRDNNATPGAMLDLWRPPQGAGDPIGCLATTYTFHPGLFDEQCLGRFLGIGTDPNREDLAFLLEREQRLGAVHAGVLVDHTQAGVEHSLRWDVLPVRVPGGKQHAKLSLLVWSRQVRVIVASANLTEPGYRYNQEVADSVDLKPNEGDGELVADAIDFLRSLVQMMPGASARPPELDRAEDFLRTVERRVRDWGAHRSRGREVRQRLIFTLPGLAPDRRARSSLEEAFQACRQRGESPTEAWIASPFFDLDEERSRVAAALCKMMARGRGRTLWVCVPVVRDHDQEALPRLVAPKALLLTPPQYQTKVSFEALPEADADKNPRPWHAKMLALRAEGYTALMVGSSNFTVAGMGVGQNRNAEANLLTVVDRVAYSRDAGQMESIWPRMQQINNLEEAEWLRPRLENEEEALLANPPAPAGFLSATYRAGDVRQIILRLDPAGLPQDWHVLASAQQGKEILSATEWEQRGHPQVVELLWEPMQPPDRLLLRWEDKQTFLPLNVEDTSALPPPAKIEGMSADDMLWILAASDPSAAFRAWARTQKQDNDFDGDLDSAVPVDLDPLRRYDLQVTFLHRIRNRARVLAQLRANLQRPVWGGQALLWRLRGSIGIEPLADRLVRELASANGAGDEALLALADFLIVLHEVDYQPSDGALPKAKFEEVFRPFLAGLTRKLEPVVLANRSRISGDTLRFWERVVKRCQA